VGRAWYLFSCEHDVNDKWQKKIQIKKANFHILFNQQLPPTSYMCMVKYLSSSCCSEPQYAHSQLSSFYYLSTLDVTHVRRDTRPSMFFVQLKTAWAWEQGYLYRACLTNLGMGSIKNTSSPSTNTSGNVQLPFSVGIITVSVTDYARRSKPSCRLQQCNCPVKFYGGFSPSSLHTAKEHGYAIQRRMWVCPCMPSMLCKCLLCLRPTAHLRELTRNFRHSTHRLTVT